MFGCKDSSKNVSSLHSQIDSLKSLQWEIQNAYRFSYSVHLDTINSQLKVSNSDLKTCDLGEILNNTNRLFFHYCDLHCSECLEKQIKVLQNFQSRFGQRTLCIIGSVQSYRSINSLINNYQLNCEVYMVEDQQSIFMHIPHFIEPFYFTLNNSGQIDMFHLPVLEDSVSTKFFLDLVSQSKNFRLLD